MSSAIITLVQFGLLFQIKNNTIVKAMANQGKDIGCRSVYKTLAKVSGYILGNISSCIDVDLMLAHRHRLWANIKSALM